jgi:hypothetical protein
MESKCPECGQPGWQQDLKPHSLLNNIAALLCGAQQQQRSQSAGIGAPVAAVLLNLGMYTSVRRDGRGHRWVSKFV